MNASGLIFRIEITLDDQSVRGRGRAGCGGAINIRYLLAVTGAEALEELEAARVC